jgi:acyl-CoA synthetase (AMP-forming)/AMP-acid ligase II
MSEETRATVLPGEPALAARADIDAAHRYGDEELTRSLIGGTGVVERLEEWAAARGRDIWLTAVGTDGATETLTFGQASDSSCRLADWLDATIGVRPQDTVALLASNDVRSVLTVLALLRAGCSVLFVRPDEPDKRRSELLSTVPLKAVLAPAAETALRVADSLPVPDPSSLPASAARPVRRHHGTLLFGTSGSTAVSKLVVQPEYTAGVNAEALRRHHDLGPGSRLLGCLPICHVNGLHFTVLATLWAGSQAILLQAFGPARYRDCIERFRPTLASVVPSILDQLVNGPRPDFGPQFRYFVSAAAPLNPRTARNVVRKLDVRVLQGYGLTETTNFSTTMPADLTDEEYRALTTERDVPSVGVALFGNEVAVLRPDGSRAAAGETGEICMRGHNVMVGYLGNPEADAEAFAQGWFHSGDLGHEIPGPGGRAFYILTGRRKNMAKVLGVAVSFEEMERRLQMLPQVADAACFSEPDRFRGEAVVAVVATHGDLDTTALDTHLSGYFPPAALPTRYVHDSVPRTATGKILRRRLREVYGATPAAPDTRFQEIR